MSYMPFVIIEQVMSRPKSFFAKLPKQEFKRPILFFLFGSFVLTILSTLVEILLRAAFGNTTFEIFGSGSITTLGPLLYFAMLLAPLFALAGSFISTAVIYAILSIFVGKRTFSQVYQLYVYSRTPQFLYGWLPVVHIGALIHSIILIIIGTKSLYRTTWTRAILVHLIPLAILIIAVIAAVFIASMFIGGLL